MKIFSWDGWNNFYSDEDYFINDCALQTFSKNARINVNRKNGRFDYQILLIKNGSCSFEHNDKMCILNEKELVIFFPNEPQNYYWGNSYSESYYVHFSGTKIPDLIRNCNIRSGVFKCNATSKIFSLFDDLIKVYETIQENEDNGLPPEKNTYMNIKMLSLFVTLICEISENTNVFLPKDTIVTQVLNEIHSHYNKKLSLDNIAKMNGIGIPRLIQLFQSETGFTPHKYQKMLQIEKAKRLLIGSNMNITEISQKVGFDDPLYFSRFFKNYTSYSPSDFKKIQQNDMHPKS